MTLNSSPAAHDHGSSEFESQPEDAFCLHFTNMSGQSRYVRNSGTLKIILFFPYRLKALPLTWDLIKIYYKCSNKVYRISVAKLPEFRKEEIQIASASCLQLANAVEMVTAWYNYFLRSVHIFSSPCN